MNKSHSQGLWVLAEGLKKKTQTEIWWPKESSEEDRVSLSPDVEKAETQKQCGTFIHHLHHWRTLWACGWRTFIRQLWWDHFIWSTKIQCSCQWVTWRSQITVPEVWGRRGARGQRGLYVNNDFSIFFNCASDDNCTVRNFNNLRTTGLQHGTHSVVKC